MGLLDRLRGFFGRSEKRAALVGSSGQSIDLMTNATIFNRGPAKRGTRELMIAFREQPWLRAGLTRIARGVTALQWKVYVRTENPLPPDPALPRGFVPPFDLRRDRAIHDRSLRGGPYKLRQQHRAQLQQAGLLREVPDHPLLSMLEAGYSDPLWQVHGRQAAEITQVWRDLKGEAFWLIIRDGGVPVGFLPIPPHWVVNVPNGAMPWYRISFSALQIRVDPPDMIWFRELDAENPLGRGSGMGEALGDELESDEYAAKYIKTFFFNGALPSAIASFEFSNGGAPTKQQLDKFREEWEQEHRAFPNANRIRFASGKMNFARIDNSFRDQQLIELRRSLRDTLIQTYGLPPELIGIIENSNRSTIGAAEYIFALGVRHPRQESMRETLQFQLVPQFDPRAVLDYEAEVPVDPDFALKVMTAQPGAFMLNEFRGQAGFDADPELEGIRPPLAMPGQQPGAPGEEDSGGEDDGAGDGDEPQTEDEDPASRHEPRFARNLRRLRAG